MVYAHSLESSLKSLSSFPCCVDQKPLHRRCGFSGLSQCQQRPFKRTLAQLDGWLDRFKDTEVIQREPMWRLGFSFARRRSLAPSLLGRLSRGTSLEVDDLAPHLFRRPPLVRRLEVCRNMEFNQFRHHTPPSRKPDATSAMFVYNESKILDPVQLHVSLFPYYEYSGHAISTSAVSFLRAL